jgi:uncharacterized protein YcbX
MLEIVKSKYLTLTLFVKLYVHPIKALRSVSLPSSVVLATGLQYDRIFMLRVLKPDSNPPEYDNVHVDQRPEVTLFRTSLDLDNEKVTVTYPASPNDPPRSLTFSLAPDISDLEVMEIDMHRSPTKAYAMPEEYSDWFSSCLGYTVVLAYIGQNRRLPLGSLPPSIPFSNATRILSYVPLLGAYFSHPIQVAPGLSFADCAAFLVVTEESLNSVSARLPDGLEMDIRKFRGNVVLSGAEEAWDEDWWGELAVETTEGLPGGDRVTLALTANCNRCKSINIDYSTGRPSEGPLGSILKLLMKDRRVDMGVKYSPIFGRYGFCSSGWGNIISVGDEVTVIKRNVERTTFGT